MNIPQDVCSVCSREITPRTGVFHHTSYEPERGVTVCNLCHSKIHRRDGFNDDLEPDLDRSTAEERGLITKGFTGDKMKVTTLRLPEELVEKLDAETEEYGFPNRTEYIRAILRERGEVSPDNTGETPTAGRIQEYEALEERLADLEARVEALEAGGGGAIAPTPLATDTPDADVEPSDAVVDALEASGWTEGSTRDTRERNAGVAAWGLAYLREAGEELRRADFPLDALDDGRDTDFLWLSVIRPAILAVATETDAVETSTNDQRYRWVGE